MAGLDGKRTLASWREAPYRCYGKEQPGEEAFAGDLIEADGEQYPKEFYFGVKVQEALANKI